MGDEGRFPDSGIAEQHHPIFRHLLHFFALRAIRADALPAATGAFERRSFTRDIAISGKTGKRKFSSEILTHRHDLIRDTCEETRGESIERQSNFNRVDDSD